MMTIAQSTDVVEFDHIAEWGTDTAGRSQRLKVGDDFASLCGRPFRPTTGNPLCPDCRVVLETDEYDRTLVVRSLARRRRYEKEPIVDERRKGS